MKTIPILFLIMALTCRAAEVTMTMSNISSLIPTEVTTLGIQIGYYTNSGGVHAAYFNGTASNLLVWVGNNPPTNAFISGLDGKWGIGLTTNRIYALASTNGIQEWSWPDGSLITNFPIVDISDGFEGNVPGRIVIAPTNGMVIVVTKNGTNQNYYFRKSDGSWNVTNITVSTSSANLSSTCIGPDDQIYSVITVDANPTRIFRLWQTNGTLELRDTVTNWTAGPVAYGMEFPRPFIASDPYNSRLMISMPCCQQINTNCVSGFGYTKLFSISTNFFESNIVISLPAVVRVISGLVGSYMVMGTNGLEHFDIAGFDFVNCNNNITYHSRLTYATTNLVYVDNITPSAYSLDGWVIYRDKWRAWQLRRFTP